MKKIASFILLVVGFMVTAWGGFCLLGGPDARILSGGSFLYAGAYLVIGGLLITASRRFVLTKLFIYLPMLVCVVAWAAAILISHHIGFYTWLLGTLISDVACSIYWIVTVIHTSTRK